MSLLEICERRRNDGDSTFVAFLDLRRAFDTVPHGALLYKCERAGIRGRALRFVKALYSTPMSAVSCGGILGEQFPVQAGVRQGCTLSPLLFDIFVDDLPEELGRGVHVPSSNPVNSLLYADDVAVLACSPRRCCRSPFPMRRSAME